MLPQRKVERPIIKPKGLYPPHRSPTTEEPSHDIRIRLMMDLKFSVF